MEFVAFQESLSEPMPPAGASVYLQALWHDAQGNWERAHELIQDLPDANAAWIHAYLHRQEGDLWNADYWYRRAGKKRPANTLQQEWEQLVQVFL
ncbi:MULTISPECIES: hypothetical protein [Rufibacter]|uniref:Tetratricopeptide repeat protein n=1 Tax=Rufibacter quisquiliarum TaxID=1549639 RepID=A0A839G7F7_9BACT|nr:MULTISPECIES: hypothetical protein [Rufibacter]MBA9075354.1 hypothetical protein [Rufibacter quisquiliarum]